MFCRFEAQHTEDLRKRFKEHCKTAIKDSPAEHYRAAVESLRQFAYYVCDIDLGILKASGWHTAAKLSYLDPLPDPGYKTTPPLKLDAELIQAVCIDTMSCVGRPIRWVLDTGVQVDMPPETQVTDPPPLLPFRPQLLDLPLPALKSPSRLNSRTPPFATHLRRCLELPTQSPSPQQVSSRCLG